MVAGGIVAPVYLNRRYASARRVLRKAMTGVTMPGESASLACGFSHHPSSGLAGILVQMHLAEVFTK